MVVLKEALSSASENVKKSSPESYFEGSRNVKERKICSLISFIKDRAWIGKSEILRPGIGTF